MLAKCANPTCTASFRYLHEGLVFRVDFTAMAPRNGADHVQSGPPPRSRMEHFWLCENCARILTLVVEQGQVVARPLRRPAPKPELTSTAAA